jgi:hypothetical protein
LRNESHRFNELAPVAITDAKNIDMLLPHVAIAGFSSQDAATARYNDAATRRRGFDGYG